MKPRYQHDCKYCDFIGTIHGDDVYICPQNGRPTIVVRQGNKRENYLSGERLTLGNLTLQLNANVFLSFP